MIEIGPLEPEDLTEAGMVLELAFGRRGMAESLRKAYELQPAYWFCARRLNRVVATVGAYGYCCGGPDCDPSGDRHFASIGMMSVHPQFQQQGVGERLMQHLVSHLTSLDYAAFFLEATPSGQRLYPKLGFWPGGDTLRMAQHTPVRGRFPTDRELERMRPRDLPEVIAYDGRVFGIERPLVLETYFERHSGRALVTRDRSGALTGYLFVSGITLGPWCAASPATAELLLRAALTLTCAGQLRATVPAANRAGRELLGRYGFVEAEALLHMQLGSAPDPRRCDRYYGQASLMLG